jgi:putative hydrolase of the HAD superfamily
MLQAARLPWFDAVVTSAEAGARKPHPAIFTTVCDALGLPPDQVAFVGDSWSADVVGALRAGMAPVWIRGARPSHHMRRLVAEFPTLDDLALHLLPNHR